MKPSIGRIVHYQAHGSADGKYPAVPRAAMITAVHTDECVDLCVFNPTGLFFNTSCMLDKSETPKGGTWHPPPFVSQPAPLPKSAEG
jgi:hypothetical protein